MDDPQTMSVADAARQLGVSRNTAYKLAASGELPGVVRLGHRRVVSRRVLERFLEGGGLAGDAGIPVDPRTLPR